MSVNAIIKDGQVVETQAQKSAKSAEKSAPDGYDKDAFLQLLVAQMKYQDPLEPTENTEYITQYATFSQVEQIQNMATSMDLSRASSMVGQTVQITTKDADGGSKQVEGIVDYVTYEGGKAYVSINGESYSASDVTAVIDTGYHTAVELANSFATGMEKLPQLYNLSYGDAETVSNLYSLYNSMGSYAQGFVDKSYVDMLNAYVESMKNIVAAVEKSKEEENAAGSEDTTDEGTQPVSQGDDI